MDGIEITWELIKENFEQARSHEEMREKTVTLTIAIATILVAVLAIDHVAEAHVMLFCHRWEFQRLIGLFLFVLGIFGGLCSQKHYERNRMHVELAQDFLVKLQYRLGYLPFDVSVEFRKFKDAGKWDASWARPIRLNWLWTGFPLFIALIGLAVVVGFQAPNHSPDPTPAPGMPPAGQESRHG